MAFQLLLTNAVGDSVDFMGTNIKVSNGAFDIGLPEKKIIWADRPDGRGKEIVREKVGNREAQAYLSVYGASYAEIIQQVNKLERMLSLAKFGVHTELMYQWGDAPAVYLQVFGGSVNYPKDVLSVEKMLTRSPEGKLYLPEVFVRMYLAADGYSASTLSGGDSLFTEVPLLTSGEGPQTGGVQVDTLSVPWVEIDGSDLDSSGRMLTRIELSNFGGVEVPKIIYIGHKISDFSFTHHIEGEDYTSLVNADTANLIADGLCSGGTYLSVQFTGVAGQSIDDLVVGFGGATNPILAATGSFLALLHTAPPDATPNQSYSWAIGPFDGVISRPGKFSKGVGSYGGFPLGVLHLPYALDGVSNPETPQLGLFARLEDGVTATENIDFISFVPVDQGLRILDIWYTSQMVVIDDGWLRTSYADVNGKRRAWSHGLLQQIRLFPGVTQRLYFDGFGSINNPGTYTGNITMTVRVYAAPTYATMVG